MNIQKKYGLVFEEHQEHIEEVMNNRIPVLVEEKELFIDNGGRMNLIIEGDNLAALKVLEKTHEESIDLIIIDPPYNRGRNNLKYNDNFFDDAGTPQHSKWLSFIKKRLKIAESLLNKDGYIFINIDENEFAHLKLLCDEIFGEENFVGIYMWEKTSTPPALSTKIRKKLEYILCYAKCINTKHQFSQGIIEGGDAPLLNVGNGVKTLTFPEGVVRFKISDGIYENANSNKVKLVKPVIVKNGLNECELEIQGEFKWLQETLNREIEQGTLFNVRSKRFSIRYQRNNTDKVKVPQNLINSELGVGTNETASKEIAELGLSFFDYPKPVSLYMFLIKMVNQRKNMTILDFFAGSGTTGEAVLRLNKETGSNHNFILCNNNQNNICRDITYERVKRTIMKNEYNARLKYCKIDFKRDIKL